MSRFATTHAGRSKRDRKPLYVSPSSASILIAVNGAAPTATDLGPQNPNCSTQSDGSLLCFIPLSAPFGEDTIVTSLWDTSAAQASAGTGNVLATDTERVNVTNYNQAINITLKGVVAQVTLTSQYDYIPLAQSQLTIPETDQITVNAYDADGNLIADPDGSEETYSAPVTVTDRDTSGLTGLVLSQTPPITATGAARTARVDSSTDALFMVYSGSFIRATAFDPSSPTVTAASNLTPTGVLFDCMGQQGTLSNARPRLRTALESARSGRRPVAVQPQLLRHTADLTGGMGGIEYDGNILTNCSFYYGYNCSLPAMAGGECVTMPAYYDDGSGPPPNNDNEEWNVSISSGELQVTFNPEVTQSEVQTCVTVYAPPLTAGIGDLFQINASTPWVAGTRLNNPLIDVLFSVQRAVDVDPATYTTQRADC